MSCPLPENRVSHLRAALPEDGPWCQGVNGNGLDEERNLRRHLNPSYSDNLLQVWIQAGYGQAPRRKAEAGDVAAGSHPRK